MDMGAGFARNIAIRKAQAGMFGVAALSALISLWTKSIVVNDPTSSRVINLPFFVHNFDLAPRPVRLYWASSALFLLSLAIAGLLEKGMSKPRI